MCTYVSVCRDHVRALGHVHPWYYVPYLEIGLLLNLDLLSFGEDWMPASPRDTPGLPCHPPLLGLQVYATMPKFFCLFNMGVRTQTWVFMLAQMPYQTKILI